MTAAAPGNLSAEELAYKSRALAQTHPLTALAKNYLDAAIAEQRTSQPVPEIGIWAGGALLNGYCLRRVEEEDVGVHLEATDEKDAPGIDVLDDEATRIAGDLRSDGSEGHTLADEDTILDALDRLIASDVSRRLDHWKDSVDKKAWAELEEYLTWWVVKGYALRVAEASTGALTPG
ncbi:MAG TPA: hypothetical protein VM121_05330 [Acidimicrobiales bacterium]|nr:hypothetical protein [Acidimicrobiales bacterium]